MSVLPYRWICRCMIELTAPMKIGSGASDDWDDAMLRDAMWNTIAKDRLEAETNASRPCVVFLNGEYGARDIYAGVPVIIGSGGVEKIIELNLSDSEKINFENSIKSVKTLFDAAKNIDESLI